MVPVNLVKQPLNYYALAVDEVCHVGVPVAVVVAESRSVAEDAAVQVAVEYEPLPAVIDWRRALDPGAPLVQRGTTDNVVASLHGRFGEVDDVFAGAAYVFGERFETHRGGCHSMECRGVVATLDPFGDGLTVWTSTQAPHMVRRLLAEHMGRPERSVRVVAPDVGGGFGPKCALYPEEVAVPLAATLLRQPVNGSKTGVSISFRPPSSSTRPGTSKSRPTCKAGCSECAGAACTTTALMCRTG
jgi:carbon-monoxide dehydrogenase large subunit